MASDQTTILIAVDHSDASEHAARVARRLFGGGPTVRYLAINVMEPIGGTGVPEAGFGAVYPIVDPAQVGMSDREIETELARAGVKQASVLTEVGDPTSAILAAADSHDVDVIVVGSRQKGFFARLIDPSVSAAVSRRTDRPMLVVPEPADDENR